MDNDIAVQATAWCPATFDRCGPWLHNSNEVVHDPVGHGFVEDAFVAETLQVHLQAFQLHAHFVRNVGKHNFPVIRLTRFGTN